MSKAYKNPKAKVISASDKYQVIIAESEAMATKIKPKSTLHPRSKTRCEDCGGPWTYEACPMVRDKVWRSIGGKPRTMLCDPCLRERLGRPHLYRDLTDAPFNSGWLRPEVKATDVVPKDDWYMDRFYCRHRKLRQELFATLNVEGRRVRRGALHGSTAAGEGRSRQRLRAAEEASQ